MQGKSRSPPQVARLHLPAMGAKLTVLTKEQSDYVPREGERALSSPEAGSLLEDFQRVLERCSAGV